MSLTPGSRLGAYEVVALLGAGGMGEVYRARDTKLNRDVALKIIRDSLAHDPDLVGRLRREAQVLASMNHPHIGGIHGLEDTDGVTALVLELVEGPTLAEKIGSGLKAQGLGRGSLSLDEVLNIANQVADALEAAHAHGIIHRDLKPANIKVRSDGTVKVLDFGLAKARARSNDPAYGSSEAETVALSAMTQPGMILGTVAYMSPEQARGEVVDERTDVWAFGCVLVEMLTGTPKSGPLPPGAARLASILRRCLENDPKDRFRSIGDVKLLLADAATQTDVVPAASRSRSGVAAIAVALVLGALATVAATMWFDRAHTQTAPERTSRLELQTPKDLPITSASQGGLLAMSPDGLRIVYTTSKDGAPLLVMHRLDQLSVAAIPGTEGGSDPFFSPDGQHIGFSTFEGLKTIDVDGGPSVTLCHIDAYYDGAAWGSDNTILFAQSGLGLFRVPAAGGTPERIALPDASKQEHAFARPIVLPGGGVLYTVVMTDGTNRIAGRRLAPGSEATTVIADGFGPLYVSPGYLLYGQLNRLMAVRFDPGTMKTSGTPVSIQEGALTSGMDSASNVVGVAEGRAAFANGYRGALPRDIMWINRAGERLQPLVRGLEYPRNLKLSPDARRAAVTVGPGGLGQLFVYDLSGATPPLKLTFKDHNLFPIWSPDGKRLVFMSRAGSASRLLSIAADGSETEPQELSARDTVGAPRAWSPDGAFILEGPLKLWTFRLRDSQSAQWLNTPFGEFGAAFSPDGRWVAYSSDQSGKKEIWVRPFPGPGTPVQVSSAGGVKPLWARDGKEIFFESGADLFSARVLSADAAFHADVPQLLFEGGFMHDDLDPLIRYVDAAPDGRFLAVESPEARAAASIVVVDHWIEELKRLLP